MTSKRHSNPPGNLVFYLRSGSVVGGIKLVSVPLVLSISVLLARWLGPEEYGVYAISWSLATIGAAAVSGGVSQYLTRRVAMLNTKNRHPDIRPAITASMQFVTLAALLFLLVLAIGWMLDATPLELSGQTIVMIFLCAAFIGVMNIGSAGLRGLERASEGQLYLLIVAPLASILLLFLLMQMPIPRTSWAALAAMAVGYGFGASLSQLRLRRLTKDFGRSGSAHALIPALAVQSKGYIAYTTLMIVGLQLNLILVGFLLQGEHVSYYNLADKAAQFVSLPVGILELLMATRVVSLHSEGNFGALQKLYRTLSLAGVAAALLIAGLLYLLGEHIISLLLGPSYAGNIYPVLVLLLVAQLIRAAFGPVTMTLLMTGHQKYCVASQLTGAAALAAATWLLVPIYGLQGAGMAASVGMLAACLPLAIGGYRTLGLRPLFL
ncbi:lipopolysaccharide biosynthesis protein [Shimia haliotis]|uniref:Membrane protein involved in the export of O-antigen and teichoic acid n=1 Tax=Shimia haliotis TaxID=1280847 RepID=A0A1I4C5A7_9RHOB|nr:lipopolysaccharide biosynthesis protein [Shimia haliotis]SFK75953.1 Membrane protein involved in the export of O-antigen and teichoic acid [Shimia haliotis]